MDYMECPITQWKVDTEKCKKGGGVALYVNDRISYIVRKNLQHFDCEMESLFIEVDSKVFQTPSNIVIGIVYRMPDASIDVFNDRMADILNVINKENKLFYMLGDLNTSSFIDTLYSNNVFPLITKPTRVTQSTATLIDHILTNNFDVMGNHKQGILWTDKSDHYAIAHVACNTKIQVKDSTASGLKRDISQRNIQKFTHEMEQVDWGIVMNLKEAQGAYSEFHGLLIKLYNKSFPYKKQNKPYFDRKPWITPALTESIKVKNKLYIDRNKGVNMNEQWSKYKTYRNRLSYLIRAAERQYYQDQISKHKSNLKKSWQIIKTIINKRKYRPSASEFKCYGKTITNGRQISDKFNKFFVNVGSDLTKNIPKSRKDPMDYINLEVNECFYVMPVTDEETAKIIASFKDSSAGWDELKPVIMKNIKHCSAKPLTHICNLSFKTGVFPQQLKTANVVPIYTFGDEDIFSNYRPVSVLPVFSKLIERLMYNRLVMFVNYNDLLYRYQFGFQRGKSTYMALLLLVDKITEALDKEECVVGIFLDFSKAFDTVNHDILLQKLNLYGVKDIALSWFKDYLTNITQYVTVPDTHKFPLDARIRIESHARTRIASHRMRGNARMCEHSHCMPEMRAYARIRIACAEMRAYARIRIACAEMRALRR